MCNKSSSTSSSSCSFGSTSFTSSCRRFLSNTCDCGGITPIEPEGPLDPVEAAPEAESLALDDEELEGPLVRLPAPPVEFMVMKLKTMLLRQLTKVTLF